MLASSLSQLSFHIPVTPQLLLIILALLIAAWGVYTLIIRYHWKHYSTRKAEMFTMSFFYFTGSFIIIGFMCLFAFLYFTSTI
ncbi:MAG: hypothetical protein A3D65_06960 [Candidatus Lloydbacteria bacterium RIFCSPHIGHO2_02_FULL_50_13]|uniref:Uncharacterized protein n=1 Tax=Candidatus Lloydbacteria bacterium RIFCSPHIGHO2_02_FULL_50_13 TaxID=1798661 RepID=A0A1G2D7G0_9BACT|nr:MAG: hypothetical protein A3D65_06960 [Candidatus Lloydbacteria bacterium RIFCSPHIGHO2_02_FULL_50_13]